MSPVGPLPPQVYWRRRAAVVAAVVLAVLLLVWLVVSVTGGSEPRPSAQQVPLTSTAPVTTSPAATTTTDPSASSSTAAATTTVDPTTTSAAPTQAPSPTAGPTSAAPAAGPVCEDAAIGLTAQVAQPSYPVGQLPVFRILVTNTGSTSCVRDLDAALQSVVVLSGDGATRLWSSNDCFPEKTTDTPTLAPGEVKTFSVKWSGTTSEPTCTADRTQVGAGDYQVVVSLGTLSSPPVRFTLTPA